MRAQSTCPGWDNIRVEVLSRLWLDGLSASQIARELGGGVTRNAVVGKVHRLGLSGRAVPASPRAIALRFRRPNAVQAPKTPRPAPAPKVQAAPAACASEEPGLIASVLDLHAHCCKWPIGDPKSASFSFCGRHADGPYCADHERVSVQPRRLKPLEQDGGLLRLLRGARSRLAA